MIDRVSISRCARSGFVRRMLLSTRGVSGLQTNPPRKVRNTDKGMWMRWTPPPPPRGRPLLSFQAQAPPTPLPKRCSPLTHLNKQFQIAVQCRAAHPLTPSSLHVLSKPTPPCMRSFRGFLSSWGSIRLRFSCILVVSRLRLRRETPSLPVPAAR